MKSNPVGWFEIYVQDIDRAKRFYESVFQVTLRKLGGPISEADGSSGPRSRSENTATSPSSTTRKGI